MKKLQPIRLPPARGLSITTFTTSLGLNMVKLEEDGVLQDLILTLHHALTITFSQTGAIKLIENHKSVAFIQQFQFAKPV